MQCGWITTNCHVLRECVHFVDSLSTGQQDESYVRRCSRFLYLQEMKSILIIKQIYYQTQWGVHQCIFCCVVYLDIIDFEKIELNSVGISVGCRIAVSRTLQGNLGYLATRKTENLAKKQQKKDENQPLNSLTNETTNTVIIGGRALRGVRSYIWTITASFIWGAVHMNRFHTLLCMFNDFM